VIPSPNRPIVFAFAFVFTQGRENSDSSLCERACLTALFPDDACGYKSETGGIMANLHDLTVEQVDDVA